MIATLQPSGTVYDTKARLVRPQLLAFTLFMGLTVALQVLGGAYQAEFGGYPDEPAHYVTSLMVRDYIAGMNYTDPMKFARNYYAHYPKVAIGHWPPFLYLVQGLWMLVLPTSRTSILLQMAAMTAFLAWMVWATVKRHFGWKAGILAGFLTVCLPITQMYTAEVMAETLLAIVSFAAAIYFARYLESERWQDSALFGLFASLAVLTKGSGWDLALVPPVAIVLTRKYRLLLTWKFWIPVLVVSATCGPWQVMTLQMAERGWTGGDSPSIGFFFEAMKEFLKIMGNMMGWVLAPLVLLGIVVKLRSRINPEWATMFALVLAVWVFNSVVPAGIESRKMFVVIPPLIMFLFAGGSWLAERFRWNPAMVAAACVALFFLSGFSLVKETHYGFIEAAEFIESRPDLHHKDILVSSERDGEGMLISELAMKETRLQHTIIRGTKALSQADWNGGAYECFLRNTDDVMRYFGRNNIGAIVLDTFPARIKFDHDRLLREAIAEHPDHFRLIGTFSAAPGGAVQVYQVN
jgi:hypothetical protein